MARFGAGGTATENGPQAGIDAETRPPRTTADVPGRPPRSLCSYLVDDRHRRRRGGAAGHDCGGHPAQKPHNNYDHNGKARFVTEADRHLVVLTVFKTDATEYLGRAGSIPVRLRHPLPVALFHRRRRRVRSMPNGTIDVRRPRPQPVTTESGQTLTDRSDLRGCRYRPVMKSIAFQHVRSPRVASPIQRNPV